MNVYKAAILFLSRITSVIFDVFHFPLEENALLASYPEFDDQIFAMAIELDRRNIKINVITQDAKIPEHWQKYGLEPTLVKKLSIKCFLASKNSRYIFYTHGLIYTENPRKDQKIVNLWHGIPLKKIGVSLGEKMPNSNFVVSSSEYAATIITQCYRDLAGIRIIESGLPRNNLLLEVHSSAIQISRVIWMPTYRESFTGTIRSDGETGEHGVGLTSSQLFEFDEVCEELKIKVDLLAHPMGKTSIPSNLKNIKQIDRASLKRSLYQSLNEYDALISDYSSVAIDFLITNKPVFIFAPDYESYSLNRGFFSPLSEMLGIPISLTIPELEKQIRSLEQHMYYLKISKSKWHANLSKPAASVIMDFISQDNFLK